MASGNFTWLFPPGQEPTYDVDFFATNTTNTTGFGGFPIHVNDTVELNINAPHDKDMPWDGSGILYTCSFGENGTRQGLGEPSIFGVPNGGKLNFTIEFAKFADSNATSQTCVFVHHDDLRYATVAFEVVKGSRKTPLLFTRNEPNGTVYHSSAESVAWRRRSSWKIMIGMAVILAIGI